MGDGFMLKRAAKGADYTRYSKDSRKWNNDMKRKSSPQSVLSETGAVGRRSFVRKMGIAGASLAAALALLVAPSASAHFVLVRFLGGIAVLPASGVGAANVVHGIQPPGEPWVISFLRATVRAGLTGPDRIHVEGLGLLLAGGNGIGTNGGQKVFATLICGGGAFSTPVATAVALDDNGDFTIDDILSPFPPSECDNPILLIRSATIPGSPWFAAGIPVR
jgi:hypothetical protein